MDEGFAIFCLDQIFGDNGPNLFGEDTTTGFQPHFPPLHTKALEQLLHVSSLPSQMKDLPGVNGFVAALTTGKNKSVETAGIGKKFEIEGVLVVFETWQSCACCSSGFQSPLPDMISCMLWQLFLQNTVCFEAVRARFAKLF